MLIAGVGFLLSLIAHLVALFGKSIPGGGLVWALHVGIFMVWIPAILISKGKLDHVPAQRQLDAVIAECPGWMRRAIKILFAYAIVNFLLFIISTTGHPRPTGSAPAAVIRGFSGHWMIFYSMAFVTFYSEAKSSRAKREVQDRPGGRAS